MSQEEVFEVLKKKKRWMRTIEIAKELGITAGSVVTNLGKLYKYGEVEKKEISRKNVYLWSNSYGGGSMWKAKD